MLRIVPSGFVPVVCLISALGLSASVGAVPVQGDYFNGDAGACDAHPDQTLDHEIGPAGFPADELISVSVIGTSQVACNSISGGSNDWQVTITNQSAFSYEDLFFVVDSGESVGNRDGGPIGGIQDANGGGPGGFQNAFRIDGTVTAGVNNPLLSEDGNVDEIFEPGETWVFLVSDFSDLSGPAFGSPGGFAFSSSGDGSSNASILANQIIPEPASAALLALGLVGLGASRRRQR